MNDNRIIKAENVFKAIEKQGYYYILTEKYYGEDYIGPKYIIATDDPDFKVKKPNLADMVIVPVDKFLKMAEAINESLLNDEREVRRWERHLRGLCCDVPTQKMRFSKTRFCELS